MTTHIDHPRLAELGHKARQLRDEKYECEKANREATDEIKAIMDELGDSVVVVDELMISLSNAMRENSKQFKEELLKRGVDPAVIAASADAAKTNSQTLRITRVSGPYRSFDIPRVEM